MRHYPTFLVFFGCVVLWRGDGEGWGCVGLENGEVGGFHFLPFILTLISLLFVSLHSHWYL